MAMGSPRPTYQQRLFNDDELPLQAHDQIIRWTDLALRNRPQLILEAIGLEHQLDEGKPVGWSPQLHCYGRGFSYGDSDAEWTANRLAKYLAPTRPAPPPIAVESITWEPILKAEKSGILGAVDLSAVIKRAVLTLTYDVERVSLSGTYDTLAEPLKEWNDKILCCDGRQVWISGAREKLPIRSGEIPSFLGQSVIYKGIVYRISNIRWYESSEVEKTPLMVEAKNGIRSAGELLRQINLYRQATPTETIFLVVAPTSAWANGLPGILKEQGIAVLTYLANG
jgi:hypothetical protein